MDGKIAQLPIARQVSLPGHSYTPVTLESARPIGRGFEDRFRLHGGTLDEAVTPGQREEKKVGQKQLIWLQQCQKTSLAHRKSFSTKRRIGGQL